MVERAKAAVGTDDFEHILSVTDPAALPDRP